MLAVADWGIIVVLIISTLVGIRRGFLREALSLATWVAAVIVAITFSGRLATLLADAIDLSSMGGPEFFIRLVVEKPLVQQGIAFSILFIATLVIGGLVGNMLGGIVRRTSLSGLDRLLGTLFGFTRGLLLCLALVAGIYLWAPVDQYTWWQESTLIPAFVTTLEQLPSSLLEQGRGLFQSSRVVL